MKNARVSKFAVMIGVATAGLLVQTTSATIVTLFQDGFSPTGSGPGAAWTSAPGGFPDVENQRITDGSRNVLWMRSVASGTEFGNQLASPLVIPTSVLALHFDLNFEPRTWCNYSTMLTLNRLGVSPVYLDSFRLFVQDWNTDVFTDGCGPTPANGWSDTSSSSIFSDGTYYHFVVDINGTGTTFKLMDDALSSTLYSFTTSNLKVGDLAGSSVELSLVQNGSGSSLPAETYIDSFTVSADVVVPEPSVVLLLGVGGLLMLRRGWNR